MNSILTAVLIIGGIGLLGSIMLVLASKFMSVPVDDRAQKIEELLPKANCGACGYAGCADYAAAVAKGERVNLCVPGGAKVAKEIGALLGVEAGDIEQKVAVVACRGDSAATRDKYLYRGIDSCAAAYMLFAGESECTFGCLGLGDCVKACKFESISVKDGLARTNTETCTGCGLCAAACPKSIIKMVVKSRRSVVRCSNHDKGVFTRKACTNGCIACGKCVKACPNSAIAIVNNLAVIDEANCIACGKCTEVCPVGACKPTLASKIK